MLVQGFHQRIRRAVRGHSVPIRIHWVEYCPSAAVDPTTGAKSFYTGYNNPEVIQATHDAQRAFADAERQAKYTLIQKKAADDAFMAFLYYSPYQYSYSNKVNGFLPYPTGNYHLEDVTLSK